MLKNKMQKKFNMRLGEIPKKNPFLNCIYSHSIYGEIVLKNLMKLILIIDI